MKKTNKKGFTLVELLAVIIILAVLILIALPNVMKITDTAKKKAFINEAFVFITAAENQYVTAGYTDKRIFTYSTVGKDNPAIISGGGFTATKAPEEHNEMLTTMNYKRNYRVIVFIDPENEPVVWIRNNEFFINKISKNNNIDDIINHVNDKNYNNSITFEGTDYNTSIDDETFTNITNNIVKYFWDYLNSIYSFK